MKDYFDVDPWFYSATITEHPTSGAFFMTHHNPYAQRRLLRTLERFWTRFEGGVNRFTKSDFNPLYHLGTLTIFMLLVLIGTGVYLILVYRPGLEVAYATVDKISSNWLGSLMRSVHRYASDAMILLIALHIVKMLISDRFWGQRWLAWTSGWIMLAATWLVGTMGYWLIWDQRAQWMTEYMMRTLAGTSGLTYVSTNLASRTFSNFVIILFLHVFLPLIGFLGIYIHGLRLSRARWWSPRWVSLQALTGLIVLSLFKPAVSFARADLSTLVQSVPMDALYLGFLPLIDNWGNLIFWGLAILLSGTLFLLPWIAAGRDLGPAVITDPKCTGCNICYVECPFDSIRMVPRTDDTGYPKLAIINSGQCTACGICVGSCPVDAIELAGGYNGEQLFNAIKGALHREKREGNSAAVLFASHRDEALGSLPPRLKADRPVTSSTWKGNHRVITAILPSASTVNIEWIKMLQNEGARDVVILSAPIDDGVFREDSHWILNRLHVRPALITENLHWLEITPGDSASLSTFLDDLFDQRSPSRKSSAKLPSTLERRKLIPSSSSGIIGTLLLTIFFAIAVPLDIPSGMQASSESGLRIAIDTKGKIETANIPEGFTLPQGADAEKIFGGQHFPLEIQVILDGEPLLDEVYQPSGVSGNGRISALEFLTITPGRHQIDIAIKDDAQGFREVYSEGITFHEGRILTLAYDENLDIFLFR